MDNKDNFNASCSAQGTASKAGVTIAAATEDSEFIQEYFESALEYLSTTVASQGSAVRHSEQLLELTPSHFSLKTESFRPKSLRQRYA